MFYIDFFLVVVMLVRAWRKTYVLHRFFYNVSSFVHAFSQTRTPMTTKTYPDVRQKNEQIGCFLGGIVQGNSPKSPRTFRKMSAKSDSVFNSASLQWELQIHHCHDSERFASCWPVTIVKLFDQSAYTRNTLGTERACVEHF